MKRLTASVWIVGGLFVLTASGAAQALDLMPYYPLQVGSVRLMDETIIDTGQTERGLLREPTIFAFPVGGLTAFVTGELGPRCWQLEAEAMGWDAEGLKIVGIAECDEGHALEFFDPPALYLPRVLNPGQTQTWSAAGRTLSATLLATSQQVNVPAATFDNAIRVRWQVSGGEESQVCTWWLALGVGIVKGDCTYQEDGQTSRETTELVAAVIDGELMGTPVVSGDLASLLGLATVTASQCGMAVHNLVLEGAAGPQLWSATFAFRVDSLAWELLALHRGGSASVPIVPCELPGLNFGPALTRVTGDAFTRLPQLWMRVPFQGMSYGLQFSYSPATQSFNLTFIQPLN